MADLLPLVVLLMQDAPDRGVLGVLMHTVIFGLQGKLVENTSLSLLIISPLSLHKF